MPPNLCRMIRAACFLLGAFLFPLMTRAQQPSRPKTPVPASGRIQVFDPFPSKFVQPRPVHVWLPDDYDPRKRYAVFYLHDAQNLFDRALCVYGNEWMIDETMARLLKEKKIQRAIVVGVGYTDQRLREYWPEKAFARLPADLQASLTHDFKGGPLGDSYLQFLTQELKPFIDSAFSTYPDRRHTFIGGSSMGGLISAYALCEYPQVFAGAMCVSTHWPGAQTNRSPAIPQAINDYLRDKLPRPGKHRIYFDYGTATLDSLYKPHQLRVDETMRARGYRPGKDWITREFPGEEHSEKSWQKRFHIPAEFLLGKKRPRDGR